MICIVCNEPLMDDDQVHQAHEDCQYPRGGICRCDVYAHATCCRWCNPPRPVPGQLGLFAGVTS